MSKRDAAGWCCLVIPAQAGTYDFLYLLDSRLRGNDIGDQNTPFMDGHQIAVIAGDSCRPWGVIHDRWLNGDNVVGAASCRDHSRYLQLGDLSLSRLEGAPTVLPTVVNYTPDPGSGSRCSEKH